ncbi:Protein of unknown function [Gryllus bimaculatus]|nr:Protein of unknown function [Gryllus bimaculatus]
MGNRRHKVVHNFEALSTGISGLCINTALSISYNNRLITFGRPLNISLFLIDFESLNKFKLLGNDPMKETSLVSGQTMCAAVCTPERKAPPTEARGSGERREGAERSGGGDRGDAADLIALLSRRWRSACVGRSGVQRRPAGAAPRHAPAC